MTILALDVMSGDLGAQECIPAALLALASDLELRLILVGQPEVIALELVKANPSEALKARFEVVPASEIIFMTDSPSEAIRHKKQSSMRIAIDLVHSGRASAVVSAGNTGALTAISHFVLRCLPQIERAPIMSAVPNVKGTTYILDLGANISATALQLEQFAVMGSIVARDLHGIAAPRVGLLNIGSEETKGSDLIQKAHTLLRSHTPNSRAPIHYYVFVEGHDIFSGLVDVVVTDGFTGNVALKTMEGLAGLIAGRLRSEFSLNLLTKLAGLIASPVLKRVSTSLDPRRFNGAVMLGLHGVVVKSHGSADRIALARAVSIAATAVRGQLVRHIDLAL